MVTNSQITPVDLWLRLRDAHGRTREERIDPGRKEVIVGRHLPDTQLAQLTIDDNQVSRQHCKLFWDPARGGWLVQDLGASNGTRLNGELVTAAILLHSGDTLLLGLTLIAIQIGSIVNEGGDAEKTTVFNRTDRAILLEETDGEDVTVTFDIHKDYTVKAASAHEKDTTQILNTYLPTIDFEHDATCVFKVQSIPISTRADLDDTMLATQIKIAPLVDITPFEAGPDAVLQMSIISLSGETSICGQGKPEYLIGRATKKGSQADFAVDDDHTSRRHARIYWCDNLGWMIEDLGSANGTQFNREDLTTPKLLGKDSELFIGKTHLYVKFIKQTITAESLATHLQDDMSWLGLDSTNIGIERTTHADKSDATLIADASATLVANTNATGFGTLIGGNHTGHTVSTNIGIERTTHADKSDATLIADASATLVANTNATGFGTLIGGNRTGHTISGTHGITLGELTSGATTRSSADETIAIEKTIALTLNTVKKTVNRAAVSQSLPGFADQLIKAHLLSQEQAISLAINAQVTGWTFFRVLAEDGSLKFRDAIFEKVADELKMQLFKTEQELVSQIQHQNAWLPLPSIQRLNVLVLSTETSGQLRVATIDPFDLITRDRVEQIAGRPLQWILVLPDIFLQAIKRLKNSPDALTDDVNIGIINLGEDEEIKIRENITGVDVPKMVDYFLHRASSQGASDIHIEPSEDFLGVRNRIDGILHEEITLPIKLHPEVISRIKIMSTMDVAEKRRPQDGRFGRIINTNPIDVRVSTFPTVYGEKVVFRLLDKNALRPSPESLGLLARDLRLLRDKLTAPYGLIMISGPTGSGKTTTLYSCLSAIDKKRKNVLTVEDPVEYRLGGVHQLQVNSKIGLTFASGLRTILRQDPDVIMVGECRDAETANMAIQAALTGHVVFSTIHTNDAVGVIPRLLDMKIEPFLVATALTLAIAQRLVRRICPHCKTSVMGNQIISELKEEGISSERLKQLGIEIEPDMEYSQGHGCEHCRRTGYLGRQAVFEVFEMSNEARRIIMSATFSADDLRQHVLDAGMTTLIRHGLKLVEDEQTTFQEVIRVLGERA